MQLERLCQYASDCPVYNDNNTRINKPVFIVRNVFCNRGTKGWGNCKRYVLLKKDETVDENVIPTD